MSEVREEPRARCWASGHAQAVYPQQGTTWPEKEGRSGACSDRDGPGGHQAVSQAWMTVTAGFRLEEVHGASIQTGSGRLAARDGDGKLTGVS